MATTTTALPAAAAPVSPPANVQADYQLGGGYAPSGRTGIVVRDRNDNPAKGLYNVCYVNGFQTQPDEIDWWQEEHDDLLLRDESGDYVEDEDWGEILLDIRTPAKRAAIGGIMAGWIAGCAADGYQAVEIDNLDSYSRSRGLVDEQDALAYAPLLVTAAHRAGLAIAQKNSVEIAAEARSAGFDFAVAEECGRYDECDGYVEEYGSAVLVVEYRRQDFTKTCSAYGSRLSVVLRDVNLTTPGSSQYVYAAC